MIIVSGLEHILVKFVFIEPIIPLAMKPLSNHLLMSPTNYMYVPRRKGLLEVTHRLEIIKVNLEHINGYKHHSL